MTRKREQERKEKEQETYIRNKRKKEIKRKG